MPGQMLVTRWKVDLKVLISNGYYVFGSFVSQILIRYCLLVFSGMRVTTYRSVIIHN